MLVAFLWQTEPVPQFFWFIQRC